MLMTKETIGILLKAYHIERIKEVGEVITQRQLADEFGIDYPAFNKYYNDERQPRYDDENKRKLAARLGDVVYTMQGENPPDPIIVAIEELEKSTSPKAKETRKLIHDVLSAGGWLREK